MSITTLPAGYRCLHEAVEDVLAWLGQDADQVLQALHAGGLPGWPGHADMDPLVRWLGQSMPDVAATLVGGGLLARAGADVAVVALPPPVAEALARVRRGEEPELVLQLEPPAQLPGPDLADVYPDDPVPEPVELPGEPEPGALDAACQQLGAVLREATISVVELAPAADGPAPAREYDTVALPALAPEGGASAYRRLAGLAGDGGRVAVRVAIVCGLGALASFLLAAGGVWAAPGAVVAFLWPVATGTLLYFRPRGYAARHGAGYRPAHAAWAAR